LNDLQVYVNTYKPDIVCLTEILPKHSLFDYSESMYYLNGYVVTASLLKGRGICMFCKPDLQVINLENNVIFDEYIFCKIIVKDYTLFLGIVYRSPNSTYDNNLQLCNLLTYISNTCSSSLVIVGDFNFPCIDWHLNRVEPASVIETMFLDRLEDLFIEQLILEPTRFRSGQRSNILDLLLTNNVFFIQDVVYHEPLGASDHVSLLIGINIKREDELHIPRRLYYKGNYTAINQYFDAIDWPVLFSNKSTQQCFDIFYEHVNLAVNTHIPISMKVASNKATKDWVNLEVKSASKKKRRAWNKLRKDNTNSELLLTEWRTTRNLSNSISDSARATYESKVILDSKNNPKSFWSYVKKRTKKPGDVSCLMSPNNSLIQDDSEKATLFNDYFVSVFINEPDDNFFIDNTMHTSDVESIDAMNIDIDKIHNAIQKLNSSKAAGPDDIHAKLIKECCVPFSHIFYLLFRMSLQEGILPYQWKQANVKALYKKGKRTDCGNYRPVSLTSIICKLCESLIRDHLMLYLERNSLLSPHQHGFRSGHSCCTQLLEIMEDFTSYYDECLPYDCIYLDFSKAFDRVPHDRLLSKVFNIGIRGQLFQWIRNFLSNRVQRVCVNGKYSSWKNVTSGIPQGSVLGPILFTIFINDLPDNILSHMKIFADDTKVYNSVNNSVSLKHDLDLLVQWTDKFLLPFNFEKCKVLHFGKKNTCIEYQMEGNAISKDMTMKDLGVTFQNNLKFEEHIFRICATANSRLAIIKNTFHRIEKEGFLILYKSLVRPILEYCNLIWSPHLKKHQRKVEQVQRRATRLIHGINHLSYPERLKALDIPTLYYRRRRADLIQVYRIINNIDCIKFETLFELDTGITRGNSLKLRKPRAMTSVKLHSFSNRVINDWNELSDAVVTSRSLNTFKNHLNLAWLHKPFRYEFDF